MVLDYTLYKRKTKKHRYVYYVRFRDPETVERLSGISSGKTNKGDADRWARNYLASGGPNRKSSQLFANYAKNWFVWEKCPYIRMLHQKGHSFSHSYANSNRRHLENHILPYFSDKKLKDIRVNDLESFLHYLSESTVVGGKGLSSSSVNSIYQTLRVMLEARRR